MKKTEKGQSKQKVSEGIGNIHTYGCGVSYKLSYR